MPLDEASVFLITEMSKQGRKPLQEMQPDEARAGGATLAALYGPGPDMARTENVTLETGDGAGFRVRTLVPQQSPAGVLVYFHGGGWVLGSIDEYDTMARELAAESGCALVLVDYRKAPEHPYPAALHDAWQAVEWTKANMKAIAGREVPLLVGGDSAGGNIAAVVSRWARDRSGPAIAAQVLIYPVTDADTASPSYLDPENQLMLTRDAMIWFWELYAGENDPTDQELSPLRAVDLSGLPPAIVVLAEHDVLRSEGEAFASALEAAGVPVRLRLFEGQMHGFLSMVNLLPASAGGISHLAGELREVLTERAAEPAK